MNEQPNHLDLFSGIGGFALAAGWAGFETVGFCDNEPYAQAVLKKHWPNVPIHGDIKTLDGTAYRGVTLLSGGFPCQPFSNAGKRRGKDDDRYLWPQMLRVIQEARPTWIIGENVVGIIGLALEQVCSDLEASGYDVEPIIIPACGVDAPHRRNRIWILANSKYNGQFANEKRKSIKEALQAEQKREDNSFHPSRASGFSKAEHNVADPQSQQGSSNDNRQEQREASRPEQSQFRGSDCGELQRSNWTTEPSVGRVANGIPYGMDRIKGLGNAIVPQVAYQIIKGIKEVMEQADEN
jgi:DNA (cytosine-5)-methyltransferase 1